jgi:hypothetical protein
MEKRACNDPALAKQSRSIDLEIHLFECLLRCEEPRYGGFEISSLRNCADFSIVLPLGSFSVPPFQFEMAVVIIGLQSKVAILAEYPR